MILNRRREVRSPFAPEPIFVSIRPYLALWRFACCGYQGLSQIVNKKGELLYSLSNGRREADQKWRDWEPKT